MRGATGTDTMCMLRSRLISPQDPYPPPSDPFLPTCARKDSSLSDNIFSIMSLSNHSCRQHTGAVTVANHARRSAQQAHLKERREAARLCAAPLAPIPCACSVAVSYRRKIHIRRPQIRFSLTTAIRCHSLTCGVPLRRFPISRRGVSKSEGVRSVLNKW